MDKSPHEPKPQKSIYPSKVDWWLVALLIAGPFLCIALTVMLLLDGEQTGAVICLLTAAFTIALTVAVTIPCRYSILKDTLNIRCGLMFIRVPLEQIKSIEKSSSILSAPALSLKRVKVSTASRNYLVSPDERERFIEELERAAKAARNR